MSASARPFSIVTFQDGSVAVVRSDSRAAYAGSHRNLLRSRTRPETTPTENTAGLPSLQQRRRRPEDTRTGTARTQPGETETCGPANMG
jgi:hypothetical protein